MSEYYDNLKDELKQRMERYTEGFCPRLNNGFCGKNNIVNGQHVSCGECFIDFILNHPKIAVVDRDIKFPEIDCPDCKLKDEQGQSECSECFIKDGYDTAIFDVRNKGYVREVKE